MESGQIGIDWIREQAATVADRVASRIAATDAGPSLDPDVRLQDRIVAYLNALADTIEANDRERLEAAVNALVWWRDGGADQVEALVRCLFLIGETLRDLAPLGSVSTETLERWTCDATIAATQAAVRSLSERYEAEVERLRAGEERLISLQRVSATVTSDLDLNRILSVIVDETRTLMNATAAAIRLYDEDTRTLRLIADSGASSALLLGESLPVEGSLSGYCFLSGKPVMSDDPKADPRLGAEIRAATAFGSLLIVPLMVRDRPIGVLLVGDAASGSFDEEDRTLLSLLADQAASAIENGRLYQQAQEQIAELAILQRISSVISSSLDLDEVFQAIYDEIRSVMPADAFIIGLKQESGTVDLEFIVDGGQRYSPVRGFTFSPTFQRVLRDRQPAIIGDVLKDGAPKLHAVGRDGTSVRSLIAAPLVHGVEVIGLLSAQSYVPHHYRESDARLLMTIANHAVVAIEHARLYQQAQSLAIAEERNRLAREIHDTLAQGLIGIILHLERLDFELSERDEDLKILVERALSLARGNLEEARRSVHDLRAAPLEGRTLVEALDHLLDDLRKEHSFEVSLSAPRALPLLAARVETALFRMAQEAISNSRKHADCSALEVRLAIGSDLISLEVSDNGRGFDVDTILGQTHRFGLSTMRERITQIGGQFAVDSEVGVGTTVRALIPLSRAIHSEPELE